MALGAKWPPYLFPTIYEIFQILLDFMKICIFLIFFHTETYFKNGDQRMFLCEVTSLQTLGGPFSPTLLYIGLKITCV